MKPKHQRLWFIGISMVFLCVSTLLVMQAFRENLVFFYAPSDLEGKGITPDRLVRIGGLVETGSITRGNDDALSFSITDGNRAIQVSYTGMVPALFREGQGAIAEGYLKSSNQFFAKRILTKHDENYMPKEIVDSLKKTGHWHEPAP